jgi:hypothetical protein
LHAVHDAARQLRDFVKVELSVEDQRGIDDIGGAFARLEIVMGVYGGETPRSVWRFSTRARIG